MLKHVLVPLDGSEVAEQALQFAQEIVGEDGRITLLTVVDVPDYPASMFYPAGIPSYSLSQKDVETQVVPQASEYLTRMAQSLRDAGFSVSVDAIIGEPATTIVEQADERHVDAIVMSTHGRTGFARWLLGSVASKVVSAAHRPVMIVPMKHA